MKNSFKRYREKSPLNPVVSGDAYVIMTRKSMDAIFRNALVVQFKNWLKQTYSPDEQFWATIAHNFEKIAEPVTFDEKARFISANWSFNEWHWPNSSCHGKSVRQMCVFGANDLKTMKLASEEGYFFANKFDDSVDSNIIPLIKSTVW